MPELFTNNATSSLSASASSAVLTISLQSGDGAKYPSPVAPDFFRVMMIKRSTGQFEIGFCTSRSGDVLTITRGEEGTSPLNFFAGDLVELRPTAGFFNSLSGASADTIQSNEYNYADDTGSANNYVVTLTHAPVVYYKGMLISFEVNVTNTDASTINANGKGPLNILRFNASALQPGDLPAGNIVTVMCDGAGNALLQHVGLDLVGEFLLKTGGTMTGALTVPSIVLGGSPTVDGTSGNGAKLDALPGGGVTNVLFQQTSAPLGWTKQTTHDNKALRIVSGTANFGGSNAFTTVFGAGKTTDSHALTIGEIPSHTHSTSFSALGTAGTARNMGSSGAEAGTFTTNAAGGGSGHTHNISNFDLQYVDVIIASKD